MPGDDLTPMSDRPSRPRMRILSRALLRARIRGTFFDSFLTVISILQGAVFALGAERTMWLIYNEPGNYSFLSWAAVSFCNVLWMYYYFYWSTVCLGAFPTFFEIARPFFIGGFQIASVYSISNTNGFLICCSIFYFVAGMGFVSLYRFNRPQLYDLDARSIHDLMRWESLKNIATLLLLAASCAAMYVAITFWGFELIGREPFFFLFLFGIACMMMYISERRFVRTLFNIVRDE